MIAATPFNLSFTISVQSPALGDSNVRRLHPVPEDGMGFFPSGSVPDSEYLLTRSTTEATLAAKARTEQAAAAHHKIASCYLAKLFDARSTTSLNDVTPIRPGSAASVVLRASDLRFADHRPLPANDELTRLLLRIR